MAGWATATLVKGRVEVGNRIHYKLKDGTDRHGNVCETQQQGRERPRAVVQLRDGLESVEFENVSPGATQKTPEKGAK